MARKNLFDVMESKSYRTPAKGRSILDDYDFLDESPRKGGGSTGALPSGHSYQRCYHTHPSLTIPGTDFKIFGGSCITPSHEDADIYIGFDSGMQIRPQRYPWNGASDVLFKITDMDAPRDAAEFRKLIDWTTDQLWAGKKVHCGCIGGHGRTGTFLAALCAVHGEKDAINYVRSNYCQKAVESSVQISFLSKEYGITKAAGSKDHGAHKTPKAKVGGLSSGTKGLGSYEGRKVYQPLAGSPTIWGKKCS